MEAKYKVVTNSGSDLLWTGSLLHEIGVPPPILQLLDVSHAAIQFCTYEELRKIAVNVKSSRERTTAVGGDRLLNSFDFAVIGGASKIGTMMLTYPYQVIRARIQQRPNSYGMPKYFSSWHVVTETLRLEGVRGFYRGITANLLKNVPAASITFVVYENILKLFNVPKGKTGANNS
ncbi:hypothetical protein HPP92_023988 [Vanilla planifolia]|uniref:Uncharacterized protein n=1 Tax=Vanilla planifolia TaxID=51239 RepID=A0A835PLK5_VANPL|nr:hypothetical protein HPP92_023988 [Vanilla planifolia]